MFDFMFGYFIGCLTGIFLAFFTIVIFDTSYKELSECELDLPRSQKCILIAVPESELNRQ